MTDVVVLAWDSTSHKLTYVEVNEGDGGGEKRHVVDGQDVNDVAAECSATSLPRRGELVRDDSGCLLQLSDQGATRCSVAWKRNAVQLRQGSKTIASRSPESMGLKDTSLASDVASIGEYLYFDDADAAGFLGCWIRADGLSGWLAKKAEKAAREAANVAAARADQRFINPYTFVPFPADISRDRPAGHHYLGPDRLAGTLTVRWEFTSPFQAPEGAVSGRPLRLPGASVKGAVRSLHEMLAGGCLRVLDEDFVPSYRDTATVLSDEWTLAVVEQVTGDGQPLNVRLCDQVMWVGYQQLQGAWGDRLATGSRVSFDSSLGRARLGRSELPPDAAVTAGGDWVVLLTDAGARSGKKGVYYAACGRVGAERSEVLDDAWRAFQTAVAGAPEVRDSRAADRDRQRPVRFAGKTIGHRAVVTGRLAVDDVVWVRTGDQRVRSEAGRTVVQLSLAAIWRHPGAGRLGDRVPQHLLPCWDPAKLCPSCRAFGAADTRPRDVDGRARQRAYAGQVRFGDAVSERPVTLERFRRAPLGAPRPGAGQFYLRYDSVKPATQKDSTPTREWGSTPDAGTPRPVRGRKVYWHADPTAQRVPRHQARPHQSNEEFTVERLLAPVGTVLRQTVTFDNLSRAELGSLLASLEPHRALPAAPRGTGALRAHLGGGKPLGLGSCQATVADARIWTAASRYGGTGHAEEHVPWDTVAEFAEACQPEVTATWPALAAVLTEDAVDPARVWYPPGEYWSDQRAKPKEFDQPFAFFTGTSGMFLAQKQKKPRPLQPLPDPADPHGDQSLSILRAEDLGKSTEGRR